MRHGWNRHVLLGACHSANHLGLALIGGGFDGGACRLSFCFRLCWRRRSGGRSFTFSLTILTRSLPLTLLPLSLTLAWSLCVVAETDISVSTTVHRPGGSSSTTSTAEIAAEVTVTVISTLFYVNFPNDNKTARHSVAPFNWKYFKIAKCLNYSVIVHMSVLTNLRCGGPPAPSCTSSPCAPPGLGGGPRRPMPPLRGAPSPPRPPPGRG